MRCLKIQPLGPEQVAAEIAHIEELAAQRKKVGFIHPGETWMTPEAAMASIPGFADLDTANKGVAVTLVRDNGHTIHIIDSADPFWDQLKASIKRGAK